MARKKTIDDPKTCQHCEYGHFEPGEEVGECWRFPRDTIVINDEVEARYRTAFAHEVCGEFKRRLQS